MSMNYVGSISLMDRGDYDRGDSPAQAILDKNARSVAQRIADETREELEKVLERVEHIYDSYENSMELIFQTQNSANMEYVNDINELEEIMKDQIKKRKYQQGLTIFIVGYENVCGQRLKLLQHVNEFFMENSKSYEEEDWFPKTPDLDLDDAAVKVDESLNKAEDLANRLGEINQEMVNWLSNYAINKASSKALAFVDANVHIPMVSFRVGKKKLEKALEKAKEDLASLSEKLHNLQLDLEDKESKYQDLLKMLENKNLETQKYKTAAEIAKKNVTELEIENAVMKEDLDKRKDFMKDLQRKLNRAENELSQNDMLKDIQANQISDQYQESQKKIQELQEVVDKNKSKTEEVKREIEKFHETQIVAITQAHAAEVDSMKNEFEEELKKAKAESGEKQKKIDEAEQAAKTAEEEADSLRHNLIELQLRAASAETRNSELADLDEDPSRLNSQQWRGRKSNRDSRPSTKNSRQSSKGKQLPTKSPKRDGKSGKDLADTSIQDEGGDPNTAHVETRQSKKNKSSLEPLREGEVIEFTDQYDLKDNDAWSTLPVEQMQSRYIQYRKLTKERLEELEDQLEVTVAKTQRKVNNLKHQFQEHKNKWESERKLLIDQVEQAQKLQTEAEKEADNAMSQLEEFINEQERLEDEEEGKRTDIVKAVTRPSRQKPPDEAGDRKSVSSDTQTQKEPEAAEPQSSAERPSEEHTEPELSRLMQQTDDAKVQEMNSRITGAMSAPPAVEDGVEVADKTTLVDHQIQINFSRQTQTSPPPQQQPQSVQTKPESPESVRESSAISRASLRSQYKAKLEETRHAVEERRSKSPAISIPSQRSLEEDQLIEDEDDDVALPDDFKEARSREPTMDVATSPPLDRQHSIARYSTKPDDPVIQEYLKTYDSIISFRDALSKILLDKEMLQASQVLTELETARFDRDDKLEPQVEMMTSNAYYLFEEIIAVLGSILYTEEREPVVSSMMISREGTKPMTREKSGDSIRGGLRQSRVSSVASPGLDKSLLIELQDNYAKLQKQFEGESKKHEEQIRHNTVVMMEMQDTINELQRELGNLGRSASRIRQSSDLATPQGQAESAIMFTRLDSERNAKIMKRAVNDQKLDPDQYKDAVSKMEDYVSIPAKRLAHLVRKYVHHCRMKEIEENVKKSKSLDENVFEVLDKMENFQNKRAKQWADGMDHMGNDRLRFANILMETLENIEQQSGIFLIKPMYSFRGRDIKERYAGKLARPMRPQRNISPAREISSFAPAPTPASNIRGLTRGHVSSSLMQAPEEEVRQEPLRPLVGDDSGITGAGMVWVGSVPRSTWNIGSSQVRAIDELQNPNMMNTPRILELDINRMMIGQNNISTRITSPGVSDDRLVNASQNNLRSYVTVNRPAPAPGQVRPSTFSSVKDNVPPSSPTAHQYTPSPSVQKRVRMSDGDVGRAINSTPPLPPISGGSRGRHSPEETSISTASLQPQVLEVVSPLK
ncbi:myosin heavy chain, striated muscle-like isoform X5 [Mytilus californianus]|uniref:myosin heavy chain, striated muscle-like isoform X5 n=1 Tax=Mytilus californianus TaxID=6549 RepID=UPI002245654D|nr:myosin heavy chain, striated muscle-like isoform X5 [Mytilus californianus]